MASLHRVFICGGLVGALSLDVKHVVWMTMRHKIECADDAKNID